MQSENIPWKQKEPTTTTISLIIITLLPSYHIPWKCFANNICQNIEGPLTRFEVIRSSFKTRKSIQNNSSSPSSEGVKINEKQNFKVREH